MDLLIILIIVFLAGCVFKEICMDREKRKKEEGKEREWGKKGGGFEPPPG